MEDLKNKVASGVTRGIGKENELCLADNGAKVVFKRRT